MTEPNSVDHWAALAGDLGPPTGPERPQPVPAAEELSPEALSAAPPPPVFQSPAKTVRPARNRQARPRGTNWPVNWELLPMPPAPAAGSQGGGPDDSPPAPLPQGEGSLKPVEFAAEIEAELTAWDELEPTATEPQSFQPQEALDFMDEPAGEFDEEVSVEADETARPSTKRRRPKVKIAAADAVAADADAGVAASREDAVAGGDAVDGPDGTEPVGEELPDEEFGAGLEAESAETVEGEDAAGEEDRGERRPDGRRRRGRGRGEPIRDEQSGPEEEAGEDAAPEFDEAEEDEALHADAEEGDDFDHDEDGDEGDEGDESPRVGFRNIPTWHDAIGVMIAKNMEARAKNPGGVARSGGPRSRRRRSRPRPRRARSPRRSAVKSRATLRRWVTAGGRSAAALKNGRKAAAKR